MKAWSAAVALAAVMGLVACGGGSSSSSTTPGASSAAPAATAGSFGVPECDDYIKKYEACITGKVPDSARAMVRQQLDATRAQWQAAAATPEGKSGLAAGCKMASDMARTAMQAYGCTW
jgi:hypothetical protein